MPESPKALDNRVLDRVRKLLARAEHPTTPPAEAEACSEKAAALMSRYVIDRAMLDARCPDRATPQVRRIVVPAPYAVPKAVLLTTVAKSFRVCTAMGTDPIGGGRRCTLVGFATDLDTVELLFTSLLLQAGTAMQGWSQGRSEVKRFRRAFLFGYASTIGERLERVQRDAEREAAGAAPGSALVLADRMTKVEAAFAEQFPHLRRLRATVSSGSGLAAGRTAGQRADLSATRSRLVNDRGQLTG